MKYAINQWIKDALKEVDEEKLSAFQQRVPCKSLADVMDRESFCQAAELPKEKLLALQEKFPGLVEGIPLETALSSGNTVLLDINKQTYFREGWEEVVSRILFLNGKRTADVEGMISDGNGALKILAMLAWIHENIGRLPKLDGLTAFLSKAEYLLYAKQIRPKKKREQRKQEIESLRSLTGNYCLELRDLQEYKDSGISKLPFSVYDHVILDVQGDAGFASSNYFVFIEVLKQCETDKLEIKNPDALKERDFVKEILERVGFQEEVQEKLCCLFQRYGGMKLLYEMIDGDLAHPEAYQVIMEKYFANAKELDLPIVLQEGGR